VNNWLDSTKQITHPHKGNKRRKLGESGDEEHLSENGVTEVRIPLSEVRAPEAEPDDKESIKPVRVKVKSEPKEEEEFDGIKLEEIDHRPVAFRRGRRMAAAKFMDEIHVKIENQGAAVESDEEIDRNLQDDSFQLTDHEDSDEAVDYDGSDDE